MSVQYRLTFESIDTHHAAAMEHQYGKKVWPMLTDEQWAALPWTPPVERISGDGDIRGQHTTLRKWAETHEQPIRNVRLERREVPDDESGWQPVR